MPKKKQSESVSPTTSSPVEEPAEALLDQVEFAEVEDSLLQSVEEVAGEESDKPAMTDPAWSEYVMKQFAEDELVERNGQNAPTTEGLRRVAELLLGPIVESSSHVIQVPTPDNGFHATVQHTVRIFWQQDHERIFQEAADVFPGNTDPSFARFAVATASTRAEGRALRKALRLKRVCAAEELTAVPVEEAGLNGKITNSQIQFVDVMCRRNDINVLKYLKLGKSKFASIKDVPFEVAQTMQAHLSTLQQEGPEKIEALGISGYEENWQE